MWSTFFGLCKLQLQLGVVGDEAHQGTGQGKCPSLDVYAGCLLMHAGPLVQLRSLLQACKHKLEPMQSSQASSEV